ncbi:MAG: hypothetical protein ABEH43_06555, partial [Flavobacteriales bacterium]
LYEFTGRFAPSGKHVFWIQKGKKKRLWMGTERGIDLFRFKKGWRKEPEKLTLGKAMGYDRAASWSPVETSNGIYF